MKRITKLLAKEAYEELESLSGGVRLPASEIKQAVLDYGQTILPLPEQGFAQLDVIKIESSAGKQWSVYVPLYTQEEGRSDLTLDLTIIDSSSALYEVEINDLHVL